MKPEILEKWVLRVVGAAGVALFGTFFVFTFSTPQWVERVGAEYIAGEVAQRIDSTVDAARPPAGTDYLSRAAAKLYTRNEQEIESLKTAVKVRAREVMEASLAKVRDPHCDCRRLLAQALDLGRIGELLTNNRHLSEFIHGTYMKVRNDLARDIRIFTAANGLCFLLVILVSFTRP